MKKDFFQQLNYWLGVVAIGIVLGISIQFVQAWVNPSEEPPNGNIKAPINTSSLGQIKEGALGLGGISGGVFRLYNGSDGEESLAIFDGMVGIGTANPSVKLDVNGNVKIHSTLDMSEQKINNLADPTSDQDAATKKYVDSKIGGGVSLDCMVKSASVVGPHTACATCPSGYILVSARKTGSGGVYYDGLEPDGTISEKTAFCCGGYDETGCGVQVTCCKMVSY